VLYSIERLLVLQLVKVFFALIVLHNFLLVIDVVLLSKEKLSFLLLESPVLSLQ
jgi:hypothetical protein